MNERIRELARESGLVQYDADSKMQDVERFAELIVRECTRIVADAVDHREPASTYAGKIREHFGVEF
jgi:hypothetical protein